MAWDVGATVAVRTLGNRRGRIVAAGGNGRYRVSVDAVTVSCREEDLALVDTSRKTRDSRRRSPPQQHAPGGQPESRRGTSPVPRLDLHGLRVEEALARVDDEINRALLQGADRLEIVHGRGTGRIKHALHRHLASVSVVAAFRLDARNPGVTWVHF